MTPRPTPSRYDATALRVLKAAAEMIDAGLSADPTSVPARLRSIHFPAALEWIRVEDIVRVAAKPPHSVSKKAITNRWPSKDALVHDAVLYTLLYQDHPGGGTPTATPEGLVDTGLKLGLVAAINQTAEAILSDLSNKPRSFLLMHLAPVLPRHQEIQSLLAVDARRLQLSWAAGYFALLESRQLSLRPEWTAERLSATLQMMLDGYMMRSRIDPELVEASRWEGYSLLVTTILTFLLGALDLDGSGQSAAEVLAAS